MNTLQQGFAPVVYDDFIEKALKEIEGLLQGSYQLSQRAICLLLLQEDEEIHELIKKREPDNYRRVKILVKETKEKFNQPISYIIAMKRQETAKELLNHAVSKMAVSGWTLSELISRITVHPLTGIPILLLVLYFGLYKFVGIFGGGTVVDFLEGTVFVSYINPWVNRLVEASIPWPVVQDLLAHDYGIITLGVRYAVALVLPIVATFFIFFSVIEDSGYLPRLALLMDWIFKKIGLNGRAVIPITLGFGCGTMATLVCRTLETRRERIIATLLLALAIPCSAQLGLILALLSGRPGALAVWIASVALIFLLVGFLTNKLLPGTAPSFYIEVPPIRLPSLSNVLVKTYTRLQWYFLEVLPLFILASILIWLGKITGLFDVVIEILEPVVRLIGLPEQAAVAFLFGFFRRDYGVAGLYDLHQAGLLSGIQLAVAAVVLTLFVPCIAQFSIMVKERGLLTALAIGAFIFPFAFFAGYLLNQLLGVVGVIL